MAVEAVAGAPVIGAALGEEVGARPTERLPLRQLFQISLYWLGINSIMGGLGVVVQKQVPALVPADLLGPDRKSTRLNSSHSKQSRMPSSA